jgi:hypothetical protein
MLPRHHIILMSVLFSALQHIFVNTAHPFFCFLHGHLLLTKAHIVVFLFFNESSSSLFPYFSSSAHRLPYFFKPLVFLLISSNPNTTSLSTLLTHFFCFLHGHLLFTKAHLVIFLLISLLQQVVFFLISLRQHIVFFISSIP